MTDSHHTKLGALLATGSKPRRYRWAAIPLRILIWPVVRAWFFHGVTESERLKAEIARMREEFEAVRLVTMAAHHQLATLQASLASFMVDRSFFEGSIRTELMAVTNVVDCYRDTVETALNDCHTLADSRPATLDILLRESRHIPLGIDPDSDDPPSLAVVKESRNNDRLRTD